MQKNVFSLTPNNSLQKFCHVFFNAVSFFCTDSYLKKGKITKNILGLASVQSIKFIAYYPKNEFYIRYLLTPFIKINI